MKKRVDRTVVVHELAVEAHWHDPAQWRLLSGFGFRVEEQLLSRNVERFRGGLVFKAHRPFYHPTLGSREIRKKEERAAVVHELAVEVHWQYAAQRGLLSGFRFRVSDFRCGVLYIAHNKPHPPRTLQ